MMRACALTVLLVLMSTLTTPLFADDKKPNPEREQIRRLLQAKQKIEQENASLQLEKSVAEEQLNSTRETLQKSSRQNALLTRQLSTLEQEKTAQGTRLAEIEAAHRKLQSDHQRLQSLLDRQTRELAANEAKNVLLYTYAVELMQKYQNKGLLTALGQAEPFTGLKKIEIDNLLEEYRDKVDAQKVVPVAR